MITADLLDSIIEAYVSVMFMITLINNVEISIHDVIWYLALGEGAITRYVLTYVSALWWMKYGTDTGLLNYLKHVAKI